MSEDEKSFWHWFAGFSDGEGCFTCRIQTSKKGYQSVHPCFSITLRIDDKLILQEINERLKAPNSRVKNQPAHTNKFGVKSNPKAYFEVRSIRGCLRLIEIFDTFKLRAKKCRDYIVWREIVNEMKGRKRGNRWAGPADNSKILQMINAMKEGRKFK